MKTGILHRDKLANFERPVSIEPTYRADGSETKFRHVVVDDKYVTGAVTKRYELISNSDLLDEIDSAAKTVGLSLAPTRVGWLNTSNGVSRAEFEILGHDFKVPGDKSESRPLLSIGNNYAAKGRWWTSYGVYRQICTNGMKLFVVKADASRRHIGENDLEGIVLDVISQTAAALDKTAEVARLLSDIAVTPKDVEKYQKKSHEKHRDAFGEMLDRYLAELGRNGWALAQATSEFAREDMKDTVAANKWRDRTIDGLLDSLGVSAEAMLATHD